MTERTMENGVKVLFNKRGREVGVKLSEAEELAKEGRFTLYRSKTLKSGPQSAVGMLVDQITGALYYVVDPTYSAEFGEDLRNW